MTILTENESLLFEQVQNVYAIKSQAKKKDFNSVNTRIEIRSLGLFKQLQYLCIDWLLPFCIYAISATEISRMTLFDNLEKLTRLGYH